MAAIEVRMGYAQREKEREEAAVDRAREKSARMRAAGARSQLNSRQWYDAILSAAQ